ncbi:glucosamine-6-phosphate deaminase [soil metagenome]
MTVRLVVGATAEDVARLAADAVVDAIGGLDAPLLGVATGSSPLGLYSELAVLVRSGRLSLARASLFALDEYVGLGRNDPASYAAFVDTNVAIPLGVDRDRVFVPNGVVADLDKEAFGYEAALRRAGGVDVQIVGIGSNGHLGFNEPGSDLDSRTRVVALSQSTRVDNARYFGGRVDAVPSAAITQGLATIGSARSIVLVAQGQRKARAISDALEGKVTAECPASVLQRHSRVTVVLDEEAAGMLSQRPPVVGV